MALITINYINPFNLKNFVEFLTPTMFLILLFAIANKPLHFYHSKSRNGYLGG
uniref:Uncharacterized protein n=1 Tax=Arundo donax TaxID=35708 RepID=A0A0A9B7Q0_ARUDO